MSNFKTTMDVFKLLEKTNCRKCNKPTCLAFAAAVFQGQVPLNQCPYVAADVLEQYGSEPVKKESTFDQDYARTMETLKEKIKQIDLASRADTVGGRFANGKLVLKILGKDVAIDSNGDFFTDIHVNPWIAPPVLNYVIACKGVPLTGQWVPFRELDSSADWARFFDHQTEGSFKKVADTNPRFFKDIIELFNGRKVENHYDADISLIIYPLPLLPMLICYNAPEDGMASDLNLFFDDTADQNLPVKNIYTLSMGLANMFKKLAINHG